LKKRELHLLAPKAHANQKRECSLCVIGDIHGRLDLLDRALEKPKSEAIAKLERCGYDVRGKTPAQIKQMLRRPPKRPKAK
jgi:hypothetical protein